MMPFISIAFLRLPSYSLFALLGTLTGTALFLRLIPRAERKKAVMLLLIIALGALLGAKSLYLITMPSDMPLSRALLSGFVFHGGLLGGVIFGFLAAHHLHLPKLSTADCAAPCIAIGHGIGRIGCFCAGCCYGIPVRWGILMPQALGAPHDLPLLPLPLIESALNLTLGALLLHFRRKTHEPGYTAGLYCLAYALVRFVLEFFRGDAVRGFAAGLSTGQWMSLVLAAAGLFLYARVTTLHIEWHSARLTLSLHPLSFPVALPFRAVFFRDEQNLAHLALSFCGRPLPFPPRTSLRASPQLTRALHVLQTPFIRFFTLRATICIPDDAAAAAQAAGLLGATLNALCASLFHSQAASISIRVSPSCRAPSALHLRAQLSFRTGNLLSVLFHMLCARRVKIHASVPESPR